ncbi:MAG TPA: hypothetical protein PLA77_08285 [Bacteroidales bacterium]|nr:hypothetical protein [Bacteroidales bacterium]
MAQFTQLNYVDIGNNYVQNRVYFEAASSSAIQVENIGVDAGILFTTSFADNSLKSLFAGVHYDFTLWKRPLRLDVMYLHGFVTDYVKEMQAAIWLSYRKNRFQLKLGNNTRVYGLTRLGKTQTGEHGSSTERLTEPRNLMYQFSFFLKPELSRWNLSINLLNFDYFLIQQETNPMISLRFTYWTRNDISLFSDLWYRSAGFANIRVNYFGFFVRSGLKWSIDL